MKRATKNLQASQELGKQWHDQKAVLTVYQPGQEVCVLELEALRALQAKWSGAHTIVERKGGVSYLVDIGTPGSPHNPYYDRSDMALLMATDERQEEERDPLPDLFSHNTTDGSIDGVVLSVCLSESQKEDCRNILGQFSELFSLTPGQTTRCKHTIDKRDSLPVNSKIYRQPDHVRECIKSEVQKVLDLGVIEPSDSPCPAL
ncbi:hypothetical protein NDU88_006446 [Pleurodeles waltl]|uniref:Uncharacterized protein n=1 Tax=Pleurodeles waltl TaxID=8319 RepID=A0AAV7LP69_PLEWA|nr:hypothetical protein NDU88_006446 [Pleurodeles waltl]